MTIADFALFLIFVVMCVAALMMTVCLCNDAQEATKRHARTKKNAMSANKEGPRC